MRIESFEETEAWFQIGIEAEGCEDSSAITRFALTAKRILEKDHTYAVYPQGENAMLWLTIPKRKNDDHFIDLK